ncbi:hypothetical protein Tco_1285280 [Tanacetum coccineum]
MKFNKNCSSIEHGDDPDVEKAKKTVLDAHQEKEKVRDKALVRRQVSSFTDRSVKKGKRISGSVFLVKRDSSSSMIRPLDFFSCKRIHREIHVSLAGPNPEHMDDEFLATAYPKVHENLKLITDERVIEDNLKSHSGSMSSMKNLEDTDNFGDQFLYDKQRKMIRTMIDSLCDIGVSSTHVGKTWDLSSVNVVVIVYYVGKILELSTPCDIVLAVTKSLGIGGNVPTCELNGARIERSG